MDERLERREDILSLFDKEDVLIEEDSRVPWEDGNVLYIRPAEKYNRNPDWNYLIKIVFNYQKICEVVQIVRDVQFNTGSGQVECFGEIPILKLTKTRILSILLNYNVACEEFRKYYKNKKIAEIKKSCRKYIV